MTKSNHLKTPESPENKLRNAAEEESYLLPDTTYTQFTFKELSEDLNNTLSKPTYPYNLSQDNIEATFCLMEESLKNPNETKK